GWGLGDIPYCLKVGKGNCTDYHTLFIALARATGIPARWNMGFPVAYGDGKADTGDQTVAGYHCWAEFYAPGAGWVPVDISEARRLRQRVSPGRDARAASPDAVGSVVLDDDHRRIRLAFRLARRAVSVLRRAKPERHRA